jgi:hypothetical protein
MQITFAEVLETIENFTVDEKETLIDILQHRLIENKRQKIVKSVKESRRDFEKGNLKPVSVDDIMNEILS